MNEIYLGILSGTSLDSVHAAIVSFEKDSLPRILAHIDQPIPLSFRQQCLNITSSGQCSLDDLGSLDHQAGELFSDAILNLLSQQRKKISAKDIIAIGSHGQTLHHRPDHPHPYTLQIGDPNIIAERTGILTISDFRRRDIAAGGQGAPLAPGFHADVFSSQNENRVIINIGGIANITILSKHSTAAILGFDTGPANCLIDYFVQTHFNLDFDDQGKIASSGEVLPSLLSACLDDPYFSRSPPKSTGREYFTPAWLSQKIAQAKISLNHNKKDILATLLTLTGETISQAISNYAPNDAKVYLCGGGAYNLALVNFLRQRLQHQVLTTTKLGIPPEHVEASLFAWLAKQTLSHRPGNLPSATGAKQAVSLGGIYGY